MLAFTHLREDIVESKPDSGSKPLAQREGMNFHELRHVYNVLIEKELRIHVDIERDLDELAVKMEKGREESAFGTGTSMSVDGGDEDEMMQG